MTHKKKEIEEITKKAIDNLDKKKSPDARLTQNQNGEIINITHAGDGDIYVESDCPKLLIENKYLKKLIRAKDEEIEILKDQRDSLKNN